MYEPLLEDCFFCSCLFTHETPETLKAMQSGWTRHIVDWLYYKRREFNCIACGEYAINSSKYIDSIARDTDALAKIRHFLSVRKVQGENNSSEIEPIILNNDILSLIMKHSLLIPPEQIDNMIRFLANSTMARDYQNIEYRIHGGIIGANSFTEFKHIYYYLINKKFIHEADKNTYLNPRLYFRGDGILGRASLTVDGWQYYQQLQKEGASNNKGFMAMSFGNEVLLGILENHFKPAAKLAGFELFRLDEILHAGLIDDQMLVEIQNSDFVVADLTDGNQGAYFEAGYAKGLGKPVIFTCEKSVWENNDKTHFDVNHHRTIMWEADNPSKAANKLKFTIRETLPEKAKMFDDEE